MPLCYKHNTDLTLEKEKGHIECKDMVPRESFPFFFSSPPSSTVGHKCWKRIASSLFKEVVNKSTDKSSF